MVKPQYKFFLEPKEPFMANPISFCYNEWKYVAVNRVKKLKIFYIEVTKNMKNAPEFIVNNYNKNLKFC